MAVLALTPGKDFRARDVRMFRPYRDEIPWELISCPEQAAPEISDATLMRVAKFADTVVGVYAIRPLSPLAFRLEALVVARAFRRRGVGRWLLGHAIGLAESKGGRELAVRDGQAGRFFRSAGFVACGDDLKLAFTPE